MTLTIQGCGDLGKFFKLRQGEGHSGVSVTLHNIRAHKAPIPGVGLTRNRQRPSHRRYLKTVARDSCSPHGIKFASTTMTRHILYLGLLLLWATILKAQVAPTTSAAATTAVVTSAAAATDAKLDVVFLVDASSSVGAANFASETAFVKAVVTQLTIPDTRVSYYSYAQQFIHSFRLTFSVNVATAETAAGQIEDVGTKFNQSGSSPGKAMEDAAKEIKDANSGKVGVLVLITAGGLTDTEVQMAKDEANKFKNEGDRYIYVVGVGEHVTATDPDAMEIASDPDDHYFIHAPTFGDLAAKADILAERLKKDPVTPAPTTVSTTVPTTKASNGEGTGNGASSASYAAFLPSLVSLICVAKVFQ